MDIVIGIDIGGTNSPYGIITSEGKELASGNVKTKDYKKAEDFCDDISIKIKASLEQLEGDYTLRGIGVGAPNGNYKNGTIEFAPNLQWKGVINLIKLFNKHFDLPVYVTNDANAAAIGEHYFGKAKNMKDFLIVTLGTGVGSGFVANGELIYGNDSFAGELGHTIIKDNGRECACGRKGCLETYASVSAVVRTANIMLAESSKESILRELPSDSLTGKIITDAARSGDTLSLEIFDYTAKKLAFSLANAVAITSPEAIFLFGGLAKAEEVLLSPTRKYFEEYLLNIYKGKVKIEISSLTEQNAAILGASALVWNELERKINEKEYVNN